MTHDDPLADCLKWRERFEKHVEESSEFRMKVTKHDEQILNLNKALGISMEDIKDIKKSIASLDKRLDNGLLELKIWILLAAISGLIVVCGEALYFGGYLKQVDINTKRIDVIEQIFRNK